MRLFTQSVAVLLLLGACAGQGRAQIVTQNANGLFTNQSGGSFYSESGAKMDQMIQNNMAMSNAMTQIFLNDMARRQLVAARQTKAREARGRALIARGRAFVSFPMRAAPVSSWLDGWAKADPKRGRAGAYQEWLAQSTIWKQEAKARGARLGDMADMMALAFVLSAEGYSGKRINNAGWARMSHDFRRVWLRDANYQGFSTLEKQQKYEEIMLSGSWAAYERREGARRGDAGRLAIARKTGGDFLDAYWTSDNKKQRDADNALQTLAPFAAAKPTRAKAPVAPARIAVRPASVKPAASQRAAVAAPPRTTSVSLTPEQAVERTLFARGDDLLPDVLSAREEPLHRAGVRANYARFLATGRERMHSIFGARKGKESVADALTYAFLTIYTASKTTSGNISQAGFTPTNLQGLFRQVALRLGNDADFAARSARDKQLVYESAILTATLVGALNGEAARTGSATDAQNARAAGAAMQKLLGVEPDRVRLTDDGLQF